MRDRRPGGGGHDPGERARRVPAERPQPRARAAPRRRALPLVRRRRHVTLDPARGRRDIYDDDDALEKKDASSKTSPSKEKSAKKAAASYGRAYVRTKNFEREAARGESLYTGTRHHPRVARASSRLFTKVFEDWRAPDSPFWVVQSKNTANNGVKAHAGTLLATYESGSAYELELSRDLTTKACAISKSRSRRRITGWIT